MQPKKSKSDGFYSALAAGVKQSGFVQPAPDSERHKQAAAAIAAAEKIRRADRPDVFRSMRQGLDDIIKNPDSDVHKRLDELVAYREQLYCWPGKNDNDVEFFKLLHRVNDKIKTLRIRAGLQGEPAQSGRIRKFDTLRDISLATGRAVRTIREYFKSGLLKPYKEKIAGQYHIPGNIIKSLRERVDREIDRKL